MIKKILKLENGMIILFLKIGNMNIRVDIVMYF